MAEIDDLKQAIVDATKAISKAGTTIAALSAALQGKQFINPVDVEVAATALETQVAALNAAVASVTIPTP